MMSGLDERRRRAQYRAAHRGTLEMDWLLGRYADAALAGMSEQELDRFEGLLTLPDPTLHQWITTGEGFAGSDHATLIAQIRAFHGLRADQ